ncbi:MAG TPA: hypothetical protein VJH37_02930 [Candidatus Nanoarchaeia archaeon]|nr:hypothetical protein [Candidatus Nanoarchaeia archaeon]
MVQIGSRHQETLDYIVQHITDADVARFITPNSRGTCYYGHGTCNPEERQLVLVRFCHDLGESKFYFHATCYGLLLAPLFN